MSRVSLVTFILLATMLPGSLSEVSASEEVVVTVDSTNLRFSPSSVTIEEGDSVRFFWSGELLAHNAVAEDGLFDSGEASRNVDYTFKFDIGTNGTHEYVCEPHEEFGMVGEIIVEPRDETTSPEPGEAPEEGESSAGEESWIPFFGLEILFLTLLAVLIFHLGRIRGVGQVSLSTKKSEEE